MFFVHRLCINNLRNFNSSCFYVAPLFLPTSVPVSTARVAGQLSSSEEKKVEMQGGTYQLCVRSTKVEI